MILILYFDNFEHLGPQYLIENQDKVESPFRNSGITV